MWRKFCSVMEILWAIYLTVCWGSDCRMQEVQRFEHGPMGNPQEQCEIMLPQYIQIPQDGTPDTVEWQCRPLGSTST